MIIGSVAIKHWFPDFPRHPKDLDVIVKDKNDKLDVITNLQVEKLENPVLLKYYEEFPNQITHAYPDVLYTLKISHSFWALQNNSWEKHMWDIQWLKDKGCQLIKPLFYDLYKYWNEVHGKNKRSNLEMTSDKFFDNALDYHVDHDYLHELLIKHPFFGGQEKPTYFYILKDNAEVDVDENKFNLLTEQQKFNLVIEEVMVMSVERYSKLYYKHAFSKMLKKFIIGHAPIWEAIWIIENYKHILTNIPFNHIKFLEQNENNNN
jgi:hypothetical protein